MNFASWLISWPFKHIRLMLVFVILGFIAYGLINCGSTGEPITPAYLINKPEARYEIATDSRVYYTDGYVKTEGGLLLKGFYEYLNGSWVYRDYDLPLIQAHYNGDLRVHEK